MRTQLFLLRRVALGLLCLFVAGCSRSDVREEAGYCRPERHERTRAEVAPVRRVDVYWDVSGSMNQLLVATDPKTKARRQGAFAMLWSELDAGWLRNDPSVAEVRHHTIGTKVRDLADTRKLPPLNDPRSDLPRAAFEVGSVLSSSPDREVIVISDMRVDLPDGKEGDPLCGEVPIPKAAAVPALVGQCLAAAWSDAVPPSLTVHAIVLRRPTLLAGERPLFLLVAGRHPTHATGLVQTLVEGLAEFGAESTHLVQNDAAVTCAEFTRCAYPRRPNVVERHATADGSRDCSFYVPSGGSQHGLRCRLEEQPLNEQPLVASRRTTPGVVARAATARPFDAGVDLLFSLDSLPPGRSSIEFELRYEWALASNAHERVANWIGDEWGKAPEYERVWMALLRSMEERMRAAAPTCDAVWSIPYER
jgi:hypothetical protein